jgi:Ca-activated chloride channel family protein
VAARAAAGFAVAGVYVWRQFRRRQYAMRFTNVDLLRTLAPKGLGWRRHAAAGAFLLCLVALGSAMARPSVDKEEPLERATVMLAIDVSLSMEAADVAPTRMQAAQEAAKQFVAELPPTYNLGLVSFAKSANVLVSPTKDRTAVITGIDGLTLAEATATGEAVFTSLEAIRTVPADGADGAPPARIVLLSDGYRTSGRSIDDAAAAAAAANVPVSTIAFGTDTGVVDIRGEPKRVPVTGCRCSSWRRDEGLLLRGRLRRRAQEGVRGHGQLHRPPDRAREVTQWYAGPRCCSACVRPP